MANDPKAKDFDELRADAISRARRDLSAIKNQFHEGLPTDQTLFLTIELSNGLGVTENAFIRVEEWDSIEVKGQLATHLQAIRSHQFGETIRFPEDRVVDWTIRSSNGTERGNVLGKLFESIETQDKRALPVLSSIELGNQLWDRASELAKKQHQSIREVLLEVGCNAEKTTELRIAVELLILILWSVSKVLSPDAAALDQMHAQYDAMHRRLGRRQNREEELVRAARRDLMDRYQRYYLAWRESSADQTMLAATVLDLMLPSAGRAKLNAKLLLSINSIVFEAMKMGADLRASVQVSA